MKEGHPFLSILFLQFVAFCSLSCSSNELQEDFVLPTPPPPDSVEVSKNYIILSDSLGRINAVKKAYQMTDLQFTPLNNIEANGNKVYKADEKYTGVIYSSVKETGTYVGSNVSFHTYMTAIHNPRSKMYTEHLNESPYHGTNCKAYYGTMCSGLVSFALGIDFATFDFPVSEVMNKLDKNKLDSIEIADVLMYNNGHVALITNVKRDEKGFVENVEISEAVESGCRRYTINRDKYEKLMKETYKSLFRYKELYKNVDYTPVPEFVAVLDESPIPFVYNDYLCADKGDKACYREDEDVTINIMHGYECLEVYKDDVLYQIIDGNSGFDVVLQNLPYGDYKARIAIDGQYSDYTYWKVVNIVITPDLASGRLYFKSANAKPYRMKFTNISGSRKNAVNLYSKYISDEDIVCGYIEIPIEKTNTKFPYIHFSFATDYGKIENNPIKWFK